MLRPRRHTQRLDSRHRQQPALLEDGELRVGRRRAALGRPQLRLHRVLHRPDQPLHKLAVRRRLLLAGGGGRRLGCRELVGRKRLLDHLQPLVLDGLGEAHLCGRPGPLVQLLRRDPTLGGHTAKDDRFGAAARHDQLALLGELQRLPRGGLGRDEAAGREALAQADELGVGKPVGGGELLRVLDHLAAVDGQSHRLIHAKIELTGQQA
mmetsp:Transcript_38633/g.124953  ORF Transcript_38633/g.124953 Transcript_38633/m.124953 type:complete len:209 (-) Transcript_38633:9-635(-)